MIEPDAAPRVPLGFGVRVSLLFAAIFTVAGTTLPYLPVWLDWKGLGPREIAAITATPLLVRVLVTPVIAFAADRTGDHRRFLIWLSWCGLVALVALSQASGFWLILLCIFAFALAWTTIMPLTETVALAGVKAAGLDYGRMRLWGSLSFIGATLLGGWMVARYGGGSVIWLVIGAGLLTTLAAHGLARPVGLGRLKAATSPPRLRIGDALGLLHSRPFITFLVAAGATQAAHALFYTFGTLHWTAQGVPASWLGALWTIGVVAEIGVFTFSGRIVARVGAARLLVVAAAAAVVRWLLMGFDPPLAALAALQVLHGLTFGAAHLGAMHLMLHTVAPAQTGTAQALYASVTGGIAMGAAMLACGPLYASYAGRAYWAMAAIALVGLAASLVLAKRPGASREPQPQSAGDGGNSRAPS